MSAQVYELQRFADFSAAVQTFVEKAKDAMGANAMAIRRLQDWLETQLDLWKTEIRRAEEAVFIAKQELVRRKMMRIGDNKLDTTEQEKVLRRAQARLAFAEEKRDHTKAWLRKFPDAVEEYDGQAKPFQDMLDNEMVKMIAFLQQKLAALEAYRQIQSSGGSS
jgi:hypothetical protein